MSLGISTGSKKIIKMAYQVLSLHVEVDSQRFTYFGVSKSVFSYGAAEGQPALVQFSTG